MGAWLAFKEMNHCLPTTLPSQRRHCVCVTDCTILIYDDIMGCINIIEHTR